MKGRGGGGVARMRVCAPSDHWKMYTIYMALFIGNLR